MSAQLSDVSISADVDVRSKNLPLQARHVYIFYSQLSICFQRECSLCFLYF